jgi:hypothetical protein
MTQASAGTMQDTAEVERRTRGRFKPGQSGNPSGSNVSKRFTELFEAMLLDFGGELSAVERALLAQACRLIVRSERERDTDACVRLSNASARLLATLRKKQRQPAPGPTLEEHLRAAELAAKAEQ